MPQNPILQPDSHGTPLSWGEKPSAEKSSAEKMSGEKSPDQKSGDRKFGDKKSPSPVGEMVSSQDPRDVAEVARMLAAHGGGAASYDLALDLVLNQVVEEARFATGATGAAIALTRAGEMVCRATSGTDAPDLGARLETTSGLSGACLQTGTIQRCGDTETDPRVNAEACRRLGVRSILVLPMSDGPEPFGVLEVFSSLKDAFGDVDIRKLQLLARRVVANKRGADDGAAALAGEVLPGTVQASAVQPGAEEKVPSPAIELKPSPPLETLPEAELISELPNESPAEGYRRRSEIWTGVLGVLVIVTAVLLGLALGWRGATVRGLNGSNRELNASRAATPTRVGDSGVEQQTTPASGDFVVPAKNDSTSQPVGDKFEAGPPGAATSVEPPNGGLLVTQNGKVIYRLPPGQEADAHNATGVIGSKPTREEDNSTSRLIHRVEPRYPEDARARKIQGLVTLEVQIGSEGAVHNIAVVNGDPALAQAAIEAVRQWRYVPYAVDGRPVEMQARIRIRFTLPPS